MKSVKTDKTDDVVYPCLMEAGGGPIVLMTARGIGMVVNIENGANLFGDYSELWTMDVFTPYTGTVCLSN